MKHAIDLPVRFGIIGAGGITRHHLTAFEAIPAIAKLVAVADADLGRAEGLAAKAPNPMTVVGDYHRLLELQDVDAVIIALPHFLHAPVGSDAILAGFPALIEKPLTCTLDETRQLRSLSEQYDVPVVAGQMRRFNREAVWLRRKIAQEPESFGELRSFTIHSWQNLLAYLYGALGLPAGSDHWLLDGKRAGGGVVISLACHQIDLLRFLSGLDIQRVSASGRFDAPFYNGAESVASVLIEMENGASGVLHANYLTPRTPHHEALYLFGEYGMLAQHAEAVGQYHGEFIFGSGVAAEATSWQDQYAGIQRVPEEEISDLQEDPFVAQLAAFAMALVEGTPPLNRIQENFNTMATLQAIGDSLRSGEAVTVAAS